MTAAIDLTQVSEADWATARERLAVIRRLVSASERTRKDVAQAAREIGCSISTVYTLLADYLAAPQLTSLLPQRSGRKRGKSMLAPEVTAIINQVTEDMYLTRQKPRMSDLVAQIHIRCRAAGLALPSRGAIERRLNARPASEVTAQRHGRKAARDRFAPAAGSLEAPWPLSLVQIDHTLVDVIVVDSQTREPIQRPWLTLAIDVCTRCVAGLHLSLEPPSATSVALCISQAETSTGTRKGLAGKVWTAGLGTFPRRFVVRRNTTASAVTNLTPASECTLCGGAVPAARRPHA